MTDLSAADAARLHRIRHEYVPCGSGAHELDIHFLLRLLDAKPAGEFVTQQTHREIVHLAERQQARAEAAEAERDRLTAALATAQARIETMRELIYNAKSFIPLRDSSQLMWHSLAAGFFNPATGSGPMPATQKGTGRPASDTGNRSGGASPAAAPSDYEAICGSAGRPTP